MKNRIFIFMLVLFELFISCDSPQKQAKERLGQSGIEYSEMNFYDVVVKGEIESVKLFIEAGMSPNVMENGMTVLVEASRRGYEDIALALIDAGADVNSKDSFGVSALMYSAISGSAKIMAKLIESGADVNTKDQAGRTALIEALTTENDLPIDIIYSLCDAGADVNVRFSEGLTPLILAASGNPKTVRLLIEAGADVNAKDNYGATPLQRAKHRPENIKILEEAGAKK
jgi:ankyrin repeat protein